MTEEKTGPAQFSQLYRDHGDQELAAALLSLWIKANHARNSAKHLEDKEGQMFLAAIAEAGRRFVYEHIEESKDENEEES